MANIPIVRVEIKGFLKLEMSVLSDNDMMKTEQTEQVMMNELQMIIRSKVNDMLAVKENGLKETINSLEDSVISKTDLLEEVIEAKLILEATVEHLKKVNEIKSLTINDLRSQICQDNKKTMISKEELEGKVFQKTIRLKNNLIKMQQTRISSLKIQNKTLKTELASTKKQASESSAAHLVQVTALNNQIRMMQKTMDIFSNGNNTEEYELLLKEKDSQIAEYIKDMDMNPIIYYIKLF